MKHLEVGKDMKIKHNVSSPKSMGRLFLKKALHGGANSFGQIYGGMLYMETNDQIMQRRRKSFTSAFSSNLNSEDLRISLAKAEDTLENKYLPVYRVMEGFIREVNG